MPSTTVDGGCRVPGGRVEVEVKIPLDCSEISGILERLRELGASISGPHREVDIYLLHPCRDVVARDEAIRVRLSGGGAKLTYKGPRMGPGMKARLEIEASVEPGILEVLEALGFREGLRVVKRRHYARLQRALVTVDEVEGLGCFVEVESLNSTPEDVEDAIRILGLAGRPRLTESYASMLAERLGEGQGY